MSWLSEAIKKVTGKSDGPKVGDFIKPTIGVVQNVLENIKQNAGNGQSAGSVVAGAIKEQVDAAADKAAQAKDALTVVSQVNSAAQGVGAWLSNPVTLLMGVGVLLVLSGRRGR